MIKTLLGSRSPDFKTVSVANCKKNITSNHNDDYMRIGMRIIMTIIINCEPEHPLHLECQYFLAKTSKNFDQIQEILCNLLKRRNQQKVSTDKTVPEASHQEAATRYKYFNEDSV